MIYTFWEGGMPEYIKLCLETWKFDYTMLNYDNLNEYTDLTIDDRLNRFSYPKIADCVRVHVLRDNNGYWLDADTIMLSTELPKENMIGYPSNRAHTIGYLYVEAANSHMYREWANYQDGVLHNENVVDTWDIMGNAFSDKYVKEHEDITIADVTNCWAETYMIKGYPSRRDKYNKLYFNSKFTLADFRPTNMLMLHNSWTPEWYKQLSKDEVLSDDCTMSNILRGVLYEGKES